MKTIAEFERDENYARDTILGRILHKGVCFREAAGAGKRGRHVCFDSQTGVITDDHYDEFSPVERRKPNGECRYHKAYAILHVMTDVPASYGFKYPLRLALLIKRMIKKR